MIFKVVISSIFLSIFTISSYAGASYYSQELEMAKNKTPLMLAAESKNVSEVKKLIKSGVDVNTVTETGLTALIFATSSGNVEIIKALVHAGANVAHESENGNSAFGFIRSVPAEHSTEITKLFLQKGADIDAYKKPDFDIGPPSPAASAAAQGNIELLEMLLKRGVSPYSYRHDSSAIVSAMYRGQAEAIRVLLRHDVGIDEVFMLDDLDTRWTPVKFARSKGYHDAVYVAYRAKAKKMPLEANKLNYESFVDLMYRDKKVHLRHEGKSIKQLLESFDKEQLRKLRNAIFARHSYAFKSEDLQAYFTERYPEYSAKNKNVKLSYAENDNVKFIRGIESKK